MADLIDRGSRGTNLLGSAIFIGLRALDPYLQRHLLLNSPLPRWARQLGLPAPRPPPTGGLPLAGTGMTPFQSVIWALSIGSAAKHIFWTTVIANEPMKPSAAIIVGIFNLACNTLNTLAFNLSGENPTYFAPDSIYVGTGMYVVGILVETVGEIQRKWFKDEPRNDGKVYSAGLFSVVRHAPYSGYTLWRTGYATAAGGPVWGALTATWFIYQFVNRSVPMLDKYMSERYASISFIGLFVMSSGKLGSEGFDTSLGLEGSHVLVTGSSGAIGSLVVQAFLSAGAFVSAFDITEPKNKTEHERLLSQTVDITDETGLEQAMENARAKFGVISTCIAVAGLDLSYLPQHSLADMPLADWRRIMNVNVDGTFLTCRAWLRGIRKHATTETRNISAVMFGSEAGRFGVATCAPYATSKSAIQYGLVKSLARDAVDINPNCRVNAIAPGPVDTAQFRNECEADGLAMWREAEATVALRKPVAIAAVARACLFLASDNYAGNITGQLLPVDGGKSGSLLWLQKT
ncbi:hypothetical protein LTS15_002352 [Exophiala xenobiotica]|nr:hypothetical protein LTS15_002352 [Exophiala xenobiotica]